MFKVDSPCRMRMRPLEIRSALHHHVLNQNGELTLHETFQLFEELGELEEQLAPFPALRSSLHPGVIGARRATVAMTRDLCSVSMLGRVS